MIRAYVAPTDAPAIWVEVPKNRVFGWRGDGSLAFIELAPDEAEELREQIHHAVRTAELECEMPACTGHQVGGGYCVRCGGAV